MEDLAELAGLVTGFATREHLTIVPAVPQHDYEPEVCLGPAVLDLPGFLDLAGQLTHGYAIVAAIIAMAAHAWLDAPLAQFLAGLGFSF